ncbi:hypothetical protein ACFC1T_08265 [Kitasatospora sp. NPDC056076]|uniref:hypothetical protein n=1 Tax=Kitasatospora sp. NPDC056076 TaxID=3345703 RepID=UPI0035DCE704
MTLLAPFSGTPQFWSCNLISLPSLKPWTSRQVIGPADLNGQIYDVHNALYTVANDHDASINKLKGNPVLSLALQNSITLGANSSTMVYWNTSQPLARVGTWATSDNGSFQVPEAGVYKFTMSWGGWSTGGSTAKCRAWVGTRDFNVSGFLYPPTGGDASSNSFTAAMQVPAGGTFAAYVVAWWQGFQSDGGNANERSAWNLTVEKISG